jgi:hypothetical protein
MAYVIEFGRGGAIEAWIKCDPPDRPQVTFDRQLAFEFGDKAEAARAAIRFGLSKSWQIREVEPGFLQEAKK